MVFGKEWFQFLSCSITIINRSKLSASKFCSPISIFYGTEFFIFPKALWKAGSNDVNWLKWSVLPVKSVQLQALSPWCLSTCSVWISSSLLCSSSYRVQNCLCLSHRYAHRLEQCVFNHIFSTHQLFFSSLCSLSCLYYIFNLCVLIYFIQAKPAALIT